MAPEHLIMSCHVISVYGILEFERLLKAFESYITQTGNTVSSNARQSYDILLLYRKLNFKSHF